VPPAGAKTVAKVNGSINIMEEVMSYGKKLAGNVAKGTKGSKNARTAGLAVLAASAGWAAERLKGHQRSSDQDYNREQQMRKELMSDG
jgi:hypothetical protein